jgi:hypothetical protein
LRDIRNRVFGESCETSSQGDISGCVGPSKVAGQRYAYDSANAAPVQGIPLYDHHRSSKSRTRSCGRRQIGPPYFSLRNHHSLRSRIRRAARETNGSIACGSPAQTRSIASVTCSPACRATYSLTASLNNWLRDFLVRRARSSAPRNTSSGMETAVFILLV